MTEIEIEATVYGAKSTRGRARTRLLGPGARAGRALAKLGTWWAAAAVSVLLPVAHLILVPLFFAQGIYLAWRAFEAADFVESGSVPCPECGEPSVLKAGPARWPVSEFCRKCNRDFEIRPVAPR